MAANFEQDKQQIFSMLKAILTEYSNKLVLVIDTDDNFYLDTGHIMPNKKSLYFGSVIIKKNYVSFHLMPVYVKPELLDSISEPLKKRMQGKSCFNFKVVDEALFKELSELTQAGYKSYADLGYV